jgi:hypothetical protein
MQSIQRFFTPAMLLAVIASLQACSTSDPLHSDARHLLVDRSSVLRLVQIENPTPDDTGGYSTIAALNILGDPDAVRATLLLTSSDALWGKGGGEQPNELFELAYEYSGDFWQIVSELPVEKQRRIIVFGNWKWEGHCGRLIDWPTNRDEYLAANAKVAGAVVENAGI